MSAIAREVARLTKPHCDRQLEIERGLILRISKALTKRASRS